MPSDDTAQRGAVRCHPLTMVIDLLEPEVLRGIIIRVGIVLDDPRRWLQRVSVVVTPPGHRHTYFPLYGFPTTDTDARATCRCMFRFRSPSLAEALEVLPIIPRGRCRSCNSVSPQHLATAMRVGGVRWTVKCPESGKMVRDLYLLLRPNHTHFRSRHALGLSYCSNWPKKRDWERAKKLMDRLGATWAEPPMRPKYMQRRTFKS